jgi:hypothetical protein
LSNPGGPQSENGTGIVGAVSRFSHHVVNALAPQFLALIVLNSLFLGIFFWYVDARAAHSMEVINQLLLSCLNKR